MNTTVANILCAPEPVLLASINMNWGRGHIYMDPDRQGVLIDTDDVCPKEMLQALSRQFPEDLLSISYASETVDMMCGSFALKNGQMLDVNGPEPSSTTEGGRAQWHQFSMLIAALARKQREGWSVHYLNHEFALTPDQMVAIETFKSTMRDRTTRH